MRSLFWTGAGSPLSGCACGCPKIGDVLSDGDGDDGDEGDTTPMGLVGTMVADGSSGGQQQVLTGKFTDCFGNKVDVRPSAPSSRRT